MVTKLRTNSGKRFTATSDDISNRPTVFTKLNNLERAKANKDQSNAVKGSNGPQTKFDTLINKFKEVKQEVQSDKVVVDLETDEGGEGWTIVINNPRKAKKNTKDTTTIIVPEILYPEPEGDTMVPDLTRSFYWPIDIKIRLKDNEAVNVQMLLACVFNTFQDNDINTVIAPKDYDHHYDIEHYITKSTLIPSSEAELTRYITNMHTYKESIIIRAIFVSRSFFYQLIKDKSQYYTDINTDIRLNTLQVEKSEVAGFFVCLHARLETAYDFQCRISNELLGGKQDLIQIAVFDLNFHRKGPNTREYKTRVFSVRTKEEDIYEVVYHLKTACKTSPVYNFFPWDEYTCITDEDKITIIEGQNKYLKEYTSILIEDFDNEPPNMTLWKHPEEEVSNTTDAVKSVTSRPETPADQIMAPLDNQEKLVASIQGMTDGWDDDDLNLSNSLQETPTINRMANTTNTLQQAIQEDSDVKMREVNSLQHTPPKQFRTDKEEKRRCLETTTSHLENSVALTLSNFKSLEDPRYSITITEFLRCLPSGDGGPLFVTVFEVINGRREFVGITRKQKEFKAFLKVIHQEIARKMNPVAQAMMYPDQIPSNKSSYHNVLPWEPFPLLSGISSSSTTHSRSNNSQSTKTPVNYEYRTDGRKYYVAQSKSNTEYTRNQATYAGSFSAAITTYKSNKSMALQSTQPYNDTTSIVSYQTRTPSLDSTVTNSTITNSTNSDEHITVLRQDMATMKSQQEMVQAAVAQLKRDFLQTAEHTMQRHTQALTLEFEQKMDLRSQQSEANYQKALGTATATLKQEIDISKNSFSDTLTAIKEMMLAQQQQMQENQRQLQEQQALNRNIQQTLLDRLTNTDATLSLMQQAPTLHEVQASLLTQNTTQAVSMDSFNRSLEQRSSIPSAQIDSDRSQRPTTQTPSASTTTTSSNTIGRTSTQTLLTTSTNGTMMLSSGNKNIGQSSRSSIGGGSTKNS